VLPLATPSPPSPDPGTLEPEPRASIVDGGPGAAAAGDSLVLIPGSALFDQGSMSSRSGAIADLAGAPWALLHPHDAARLGLSEGDGIVLSAANGSLALRAILSPAVLPGQVYVPRGYDAAPVNALIDASQPVSRVRVHGLAAVAGAAGAPEGGV